MALRLLFAIPVSLMLCSWLVLESGHHSCAVRRFGQYSCVLLLEAPLRLCPTIERGSLPRATDQTALQSSRSGRQVTRVSLGLQLAQRLDCP